MAFSPVNDGRRADLLPFFFGGSIKAYHRHGRRRMGAPSPLPGEAMIGKGCHSNNTAIAARELERLAICKLIHSGYHNISVELDRRHPLAPQIKALARWLVLSRSLRRKLSPRKTRAQKHPQIRSIPYKYSTATFWATGSRSACCTSSLRGSQSPSSSFDGFWGPRKPYINPSRTRACRHRKNDCQGPRTLHRAG